MRCLRVADLFCGFVLAALLSPSIAATAHQPSYPLAVKSPYLSTWVAGNQTLNAATAQPTFWNGICLTWPVLAHVDGQTYTLLGGAGGIYNSTAANTNSVSYSSSHTYIHVTAGQATFELDYFSPVLPGKDEYARHSLPYSYLTVSVSSNDYKPPSVQILSAINYTWTRQNGSSNLNYTTSGDAGFFWYYN